LSKRARSTKNLPLKKVFLLLPANFQRQRKCPTMEKMYIGQSRKTPKMPPLRRSKSIHAQTSKISKCRADHKLKQFRSTNAPLKIKNFGNLATVYLSTYFYQLFMAWSGGPGTDVMIFFHFYRIFWQKKWRF
jgi:hypothetical protein